MRPPSAAFVRVPLVETRTRGLPAGSGFRFPYQVGGPPTSGNIDLTRQRAPY